MNRKSIETKVTVRNCVTSDLAVVQKFMDALYAHDANIAHLPRPDISITQRHLSEHPDKGRLVVLEADGTPCGYAILIFFWSNEYSQNLIEIDEIFVDDAFRGCGVGREFFKWLRSTFAETSAGWTLQVAHKNADARRLYERLGFKTSRNEHMICIFAEQSQP